MSSLFSESSGGLFGSRSAGSGGGSTRRRRRMTPQQLQALTAAVASLQLGQPREQNKSDIDYSWKRAFGITDIGGRALGQIGTALIYTPVGLYELGKAASHDTAALLGQLPGASDYARRAAGESFRSDDLAKAIAQGYYEDFRHPLRNPGYLAMDLFGLASLGAGTAARTSAALGKVRPMREARLAARRGEPPPDLGGAPPATPGPPRPPSGQLPARTVPTQQSLFNLDAMGPQVHPGQLTLGDALAELGGGPRVTKRDLTGFEPVDNARGLSDRDQIIDVPQEAIDLKDEQLREIYSRADLWRNPAAKDFRIKATPDEIRLEGTPFRAIRRDRDLYKPDIQTGTMRTQPESLAGGDVGQFTQSAIEQANEYRRLTGSVARLQKALMEAEEKGTFKGTIRELLSAADEMEKQAGKLDKFAGYSLGSYRRQKTGLRAGLAAGADPQLMGGRLSQTASANKRLMDTRQQAADLRGKAQEYRQLAEDLGIKAEGADRTAIKAIEKRLGGAVEKLQLSAGRRSLSKQQLDRMVGGTGRVIPQVEKAVANKPESRPLWQLYRDNEPISGAKYIEDIEGTKTVNPGGGRIFVTGNTPLEAAENALAQLTRVEAEHHFLGGYKKASHKDTYSLVYGGANVREAMVRRADQTRKINQFEKRQEKQGITAAKREEEQSAVQKLLAAVEKHKQGVDPDDPRAAAMADLASLQASGKVSKKTQEKVERDLQPRGEKKLLAQAQEAQSAGDFLAAFSAWQKKYGAPDEAAAEPPSAPAPPPAAVTRAEESPAPPTTSLSPPATPPAVRTAQPSTSAAKPIDRWADVDRQLEQTELIPRLVTGRIDEYRKLFREGHVLIDRDGKKINESEMDAMIDAEVARQRKLDPDARSSDPVGREGLMRDRAEEAIEWRLFGIEKMNYARRKGIFFGEKPTREDFGAVFGDVLDQTPREKGINPRNLGDAPRATGDSLRQRKLSKRDLGVSTKQLRAAGVEGELRAKAEQLHKELRPLYEREGQPPTMGEIYTALSRVLGEADAKQLMKARGGTDVPTLGQIMREFAKEFMKKPQPGVLTIGYDRHFIEKEEKLDPERPFDPDDPDTYFENPEYPGTKIPFTIFEDIEKVERVEARMLLSRNPLIRRFQIWQGHLMEQHPDSRVGPFGRSLSKTVDKEIQAYKKITDRIKELEVLKDAEEQLRRAEVAKTRHLRPIDFLDTFNEGIKILTLYAKGAYLTMNMAGQLLIATAHHNLNPISMARTSKLQHELRARAKSDEEWAAIDQRIQQVMGMGMIQSLGHGINEIAMTGRKSDYINLPRATVVGVRAISNKIQEGYKRIPGLSRILDTPFRWNAFLHEAHMKGYSDAESIHKLVMDPEFTDDLVEVAQRANKAAIDYTRMGRAEKEIFRRIIFFYPWVKGATMYAGHFAAEHPLQLMAQVGAARVGQERAEEKLGKVPSYAEGLIPQGSREVPGLGEVPTVINPAAFSVLGTPGDVLGVVRAGLVGGRRESEAVSEFLNPLASAGVGWALGVDPFTGRTYPRDMSAIDIVAQEALQAGALTRLGEQVDRAGQIERGELDASEILYPRSKKEAILNWATGAYPFAINPKEAQSRGYAEEQSLKSREQRELDKADFNTKLYEEAFAKIDRPMPDNLRNALELNAKRNANLAMTQKELGHELSQLDRLRSDLDLIVREGMMQEEQARSLLMQVLQADDESLETYRERLAQRYFGRKLVTGWRRNFLRIGVELPS